MLKLVRLFALPVLAAIILLTFSSCDSDQATGYPQGEFEWVVESVSPTLTSVSGTRSDNIWAAGKDGWVLQSDGRRWSRVEDFGSSFNATAILAFGDTVIVTAYGLRVATYDGSEWTARRINGILARVQAMWGVAPDSVWGACDDGKMIFYDGAAWTEIQTPATENLWDVWGTSSSDIYAVGEQGRMLHFDGSVWDTLPTLVPNRLVGIDGTGPNDIWAITQSSFMVHFDGNDWSLISTIYLPGHAYDLAVTDGGSVYAATTEGHLYHYTGKQYTDAWDLVEIPGIHPNIWDVCVVDGATLAAVGDYGTIVIYDGTTARNQSIGFGMDLYDVAAVDRSTALVITSEGYLYEYSHGALSRFEPRPPNRWHFVLAVRPSEMYVGGVYGLQRFNGYSWERILDRLDGDPVPASVYATPAGILYGVLDNGNVFKLRGDNFQEISTDAFSLGPIWVSRSGTIFTGGMGGTVLMYTDTTIDTIDVPGSTSVDAIWGTSDTSVYFVDRNVYQSSLYYFDGDTCVHYDTPGLDVALTDVFGFGPDDVYVVGYYGTWLHLLDHEAHIWDMSADTYPEHLRAIDGYSQDHIIAVGTRGTIFRGARR